jgi:hypothetical protein
MELIVRTRAVPEVDFVLLDVSLSHPPPDLSSLLKSSFHCTDHEENGRYPILHSPRSSFSQETDATPGSQTITACNSFESVNTAASQTHHQDHPTAQPYHLSEQQHHVTSTTHLFPTAYQSQQINTAQPQYQYPSQGARIQWTPQHAQSQPTYNYYAPDEGSDIGYQHVAGSAGSESEWGTIEKRSL